MSQTSTAPAFNSGDHVRIIDAEPGVPDPKSLVYYEYYRNLTGSVVKAYPDGTVAISIDRKALPQEIRGRHEESERSQQERWLNNLSEEERNRISEKEKSFSLRYTVLVSAKYVVPELSGAHAAKPPKQKPPAQTLPTAPASRPTTADLEAAEAEYLKSKKV